nr:AMP-binding protein [Mycobacterium sp. OAS707]
MPVTIPEVVAQRAERTPDALFMADSSGATMTFGELAEAVERTAAGMAHWGVNPGDVVSWQLPNGCSTVVLMLALRRLSAVQNPLITTLGRREVTFICEQARTNHLVVRSRSDMTDDTAAAQSIGGRASGLRVHALDGELPSGVADQPRSQISMDAECRWLFYTSGTTSTPKGVRHCDQSLIAAAAHLCDTIGLGPNDQLAAPVPLAHVGGILHVLSVLMAGASILTCAAFDDAAIDFFAAQRVTLLGSGVPFFHAYLKRQRAHLQGPLFPHLRAALSGGAPCPPSLRHTVKRELGGAGVVSGWGLTECPFLTIGRAEDDGAAEGRPAAGSTVEAVRPDGTPASPGQEGELRVKSPQMMLGYTDPALGGDAFDDRGRFRTGDLGVVEPSGVVRITGRLKDIIIRKMENVSAQEVEELLSTHPAVADVAVVGIPDQSCGERVCAVIVAADHRNPPNLADLGAHLRGLGLSTRKLPEQLEVLNALPRNSMGKVIKSDLRARFTPDVAQR